MGGDPGIGKSTLMLQALGLMSSPARTLTQNLSHKDPIRTLYVTSEESAEQVRLRAARLGVRESEHLYVLADTNLARIVEQARRVRPSVMAIDSIQMVYKGDLDASPGTIPQLRRCCTDLVYLAKATGTAVVLVGHVTKDGQLAGPRLLEHLVDAVLYFEGDRYHAHRVVRAIKNRFGTTLRNRTLRDVRRRPPRSPRRRLRRRLRPRRRVLGLVVLSAPSSPALRCVLVELQALTAMGFPGAIKRKTSGLDPIPRRHARRRPRTTLRPPPLYDRDVFASSVGGVRVTEPASDLPLALAIAGAFHKKSLGPPPTAAVGEVGLGGEIRPVNQMESRLREAARLGYQRLLAPQGTKPPKGLKLDVFECRTLQQALEHLA